MTAQINVDYSVVDASKQMVAEFGVEFRTVRLRALLESWGWLRRGRQNCWVAAGPVVTDGYMRMVPGGHYARNGVRRQGPPVPMFTEAGLGELRQRIARYIANPGRAP